MPAEYVHVEIYAEPVDGGKPFRQELARTALLAGTENAFAYLGTVPADRPGSDYTPRLTPQQVVGNRPLEANHILWYRRTAPQGIALP